MNENRIPPVAPHAARVRFCFGFRAIHPRVLFAGCTDAYERIGGNHLRTNGWRCRVFGKRE
jgi:hypothetical protein